MKWQCIIVVGLGLAVCQGQAQPEEAKGPEAAAEAPTEVELKTLEDKAGYMIGLQIGESFVNRSIEVNLKAVLRGVEDALAGRKLLDDEELKKIAEEFDKVVTEKQTKRAAENKAVSDKFLAENKKKPGVITLPSGLQYKVIKEGTGEKPKVTDKVKAIYLGTLLDGTPFGSSKNEPAVIPVRGAKGFTEGLQLMGVGAKWELYIPPELAYGDRVQGKIGANSVLLFEIEVLGIEPSTK
jgi:FKBP-type peptidyl-prolyl cis-trans isomerase FklB